MQSHSSQNFPDFNRKILLPSSEFVGDFDYRAAARDIIRRNVAELMKENGWDKPSDLVNEINRLSPDGSLISPQTVLYLFEPERRPRGKIQSKNGRKTKLSKKETLPSSDTLIRAAMAFGVPTWHLWHPDVEGCALLRAKQRRAERLAGGGTVRRELVVGSDTK